MKLMVHINMVSFDLSTKCLNLAKSFDLDLKKDINSAYQEFEELMINADKGRGILLLYDIQNDTAFQRKEDLYSNVTNLM